MSVASAMGMNFSHVRVSNRVGIREGAVLLKNRKRIPVDVLDMGLEGFGLYSLVPMEIGDLVELQVNGEWGLEGYVCEVVFCRWEEDRHRLGLRIVDQVPDIVILDSEG